MPYNIQLPDGRIVTDIPDSIDPVDAKAEIARKLGLGGQEEPSYLRQLVSAPSDISKGFLGGLFVDPISGAASLAYTGAQAAGAGGPSFEQTGFGKGLASVQSALAPSSEGTISHLSSGLGSLLSFIPGGMVKGGLGLVLRLAQAGSIGAEEARQRIEETRLKEGIEATPSERLLAQTGGTAVGFTELLPAERLVAPLRNVLRGVPLSKADEIAPGLFNSAKRMLVTGGMEGLQEGMSNVAQDLLAKGIYNPNLDIGQSALGDAAMGASVGAFAQGAMELLTRGKRGKMYRQLKDEEQAKADEERMRGIEETQNARDKATVNPLGYFTAEDLSPEYVQSINDLRLEQGKVKLNRFTIEDLVESGAHPEEINQLISERTGFDESVQLTPDQVIAAAQEKNIDIQNKGFSDFLRRTTGSEALDTMSQPQLHAAFKSIEAMPAFEAVTPLPEGSNATKFTQSDYNTVVEAVKAALPKEGEITFDQAVKASGKPAEEAQYLLGLAAQNGDLNGVEKSRFDLVDGEGSVVRSYANRADAERAAANRGLSVEESTSISFAPVSEDVITEDGLTIRKGTFKQPAGYEIRSDAAVLDVAANPEEAEAKADGMQERREKKAKQLQDQAIKLEEEIAKSNEKLEELKAEGRFESPLFKKTEDNIKKNNAKLQAQIERLNVQSMGFLGPLQITPRMARPSKRSGFTVFNQAGDPVGTFKTIDEARQQAPLVTKPTEEFQAKADELVKRLRPLMDRLGLSTVRLNIEKAIKTPMGSADGYYLNNLIAIAMDAENPVRALRHEGVHALKELGAFTPDQWRVLENKAKSEWMDKYDIRSRYKGLSEEEMLEEAISDAFSDFDQTKPPVGMVGALFRKVKQFLEALGNALRGMGFQTSEGIFEKVEAGEMQAKEPVAATNESKLSLKIANRVAKQLDLNQQQIKSTSIGLQTGKSGTQQFKQKNIGGLPQVVQFLEDRRANSGLKPLDINKEEDREELSKLMAAEAMASINAGGNALEWYDSVIDTMMNIATLKYPELATDTNKQTVFRLSIAIASQGLNVEDNLAFAMKQYEGFRQTGKFKEIGSGADGAAMKSNYILANEIIDQYGLNDVSKFLQTEFTVKELRDAGFDVGGELGDEMVTGSSIFGPKIGFGFYSNLSGNFEPVTMDMWFMRTVGRLTGNLKSFDQEKFDNQILRFKNAFKEFGDDGVYANDFNDSEIEKASENIKDTVEFARVVNSVFNSDFKNNRELYDEGARKKSELVYAAQNVIKSYDAPKDAPKSATERRLLRDMVGRMVKKVEAAYGKRIPPASLQALIWYPEQELYKALGVKLRVTSQDYARAIKKILEKEGYDEQSIDRAAKSGSRGIQPVAGEQVQAGAAPISAKPRTTFSEDEREKFIEEGKTKQVIKQERETPKRRKVIFEVAPDPNNVELTNKWRSLPQEDRLNISNDIAKKIIKKAKNVLDFDGLIVPQVGSYLDDTNPSFALFLDKGDAVAISKFIGYALSQDSMMVVSPKPANGLKKVGAVAIDIGTQSPDAVDFIYQQLREITVNGEKVVGGQTTMNNTMLILNYSDLSSENLAKLIDDKLGNDYSVEFTDVYSAFPEKKDYDYASTTNVPRGKEAVIREQSRSLRAEATNLLEERLKQEPTRYKQPEAEATEVTGGKAALRAPKTEEFKRWFGKSKIVGRDGQPKVMYHGTARDITEFKPKQANAIFLTSDPNFAEGFSAMSESYMAQKAKQEMPEKELDKLRAKAQKNAKKNGTDFADELTELLRQTLPSNQNILPVFVRAEDPFDYADPKHRERISEWLDDPSVIHDVARGSWGAIESEAVQNAIKQEGFDGFYVLEGGRKNLAVYKSNQIKSATGNVGTYDITNPDIRYSMRDSIDPLTVAAIDRTTTARQEKGFMERMADAISPTAMTAFRQAHINKLEAIEQQSLEVARMFGSTELFADTSAIASALMSDRAAGVAAESFKNGVPIFKNGFTSVSDLNGKVKGLIPILEPLAKYKDPFAFRAFQFYAATRRGRRLTAEGRERMFTRDEIRRGEALEKQFDVFKQVFDEYQQYNKGLVDFMKDTGVISDAEAKIWTQNWDYIPFYRQMEGESTAGPKVFSPIAGVGKPKKLKGGEEPLADFMETIIRNSRAAIEAGMKNEAARRVIRDMLRLNQGKLVPAGTTGADIVTIKDKGVTKHYQVADRLLVEALKGLNLPQLPFLEVLAAPANILRNLVTKDPGFMIANLARDSMQAWVTSGVSMTPLVDTFKQAGLTLAGMSPEAKALAGAGLFGGYDFANDVQSSSRAVEAELRKRVKDFSPQEIALMPLNKIWEALDKGSTASDVATRAEVYKRVLKETGNEAEAIYQAMEVMNFSRKGNSALIRILSAVVPFLNARIQGLDVLYRSGFGKMATQNKEAMQKAFITRSLTILALSAMYWMMASDTDEYKTAEPETRDNYWIFGNVRIPIPFEIGTLFKVMPERILEYYFGQDTGADLKESIVRNITSTLGFNPIPQALLPMVENTANYSFFTGKPIVGMGLEGMEPKFQIGSNTSMLAQKVGEATNYSPVKIDNLIKGYTGTLGSYASMMLDSVLRGEGDPTKASMKLEQMPVFKRFMSPSQGTGTISAYYELKDSVDTATRTINFLERTGNMKDLQEYMQGKGGRLLAIKPYIQVLDRDMTQLNDMKKLVQISNMPPDKKRDVLDNIKKAEVNLTYRIQAVKKMLDR